MKRLPPALPVALLAPLLAGFAPPDPVPLLEARGPRLELAGALTVEAMAYEDPAGPGSAAFVEETAAEPVPGAASGRRIVRTFRPRAPGAAPSRFETVWAQEREPGGDLLVRCRLSLDDPNGLFHATPRPDGSLAGVCVELHLTGLELGGGSVAYGDETTRRDEQGWEIRSDGATETDPATTLARASAAQLLAAGRRLRVTVERGGEPLRLSESGRFSFAPDGAEDCRHVFRFHAIPDPERPGAAAAEVEIRLRSPSPESLRLARAEEARARTIARLDLFRAPALRLRRLPLGAALARLAAQTLPDPGVPDDLVPDLPALRFRAGDGPAPVIDFHGRDVPLREALCELADLAGLEVRVDGGAFVLEDFDPHVRHLSFRMGTPKEDERIAEDVEARLRRTVSPPAVFRDAPVSEVLAFLSDAAAAGAPGDGPPPRFALRLWQTAGEDGAVPPDPTRVTINRPQGATLHELVEAIASQNRLFWSVQRRTVVFESEPD